jgi:hypothetical protein
MDSTPSAKRLLILGVHTVKFPCAYIVGHRKPRGWQYIKSKIICNPKKSGLCTKFEAAGSVVTVKRSPVSKRVKARDAAKGTDILSSGQSKPPLERDSV